MLTHSLGGAYTDMKLNATKDQVFRMLKFIEFLRKEINAEFPPQQLMILFLVAHNNGISQSEISNLLAMPEGTVSRNIAKLSERIRRTPSGGIERFGYGLVETRQDDYEDIRKKNVYLTDRGMKIINQLAETLYD